MLDTNVIVAALRSPAGASAALLRAARRGDLTFLANVALALEYEATCSRAEHQLAAGLNAVKGDLGKREAMYAAMRKATVDSPRGKFTLNAAGNPVQDMYVREAKGVNNELVSVAVKGLADPARGSDPSLLACSEAALRARSR